MNIGRNRVRLKYEGGILFNAKGFQVEINGVDWK